MKSDGSAERESILGYGERWKWASALGRPIELEGLMLAEFLAWFSREYGLEVAYDSVSLEQDAGHMELGGSVRGLDEVQALASVITAVGLQYELQGGLVTISRLTTD